MPAAIALTFERAFVAGGAFSCEVSPVPSWPALLLPQHLTPVEAISAHVCTFPAVIALTLRRTSVKGGELSNPPTPPLPSWPPLKPQHLTPPHFIRAQVWNAPVAIALTLVRTSTVGGAFSCPLELPLPSCPAELPPQHLTPPQVIKVKAHVWTLPSAIAVTLVMASEAGGAMNGNVPP